MEVDDLPQTEPLSEIQRKNNAGGYSFVVDDMTRLRRFLCLGSEGGTYYVKEKKLGKDNVACLERLLAEKRGMEAIREIVTFSVEGRTAKQNSLLFCLAFCARQEKDMEVKKYAYGKLKAVCRIPTHLFQFIQLAEDLSSGTGWGRAQRRAVCDWYNQFIENPEQLANHITKYQKRGGWSHVDVLRLAHPVPKTEEIAAIIRYIIKGLDETKKDFLKDESSEKMKKVIGFLGAVQDIKTLTVDADVAAMIRQFNLVREHVPTQFLKSQTVWTALLEKMPMTAMIRNLGKMTEVGILARGSDGAKIAMDKLGNENALRKARIHPFNVLVATKVYQKGKGEKGSLTWEPNPDIVKALDGAFYKSFKNVEPTGKRYCLAIDVSGSMGWGTIIGSESISPMDGAAAMAMVTVHTEKEYECVGFSHNLRTINLSKEMDLNTVIQTISNIPMGGTDCALPMMWAKQQKKDFDAFIVYTDSETYFGKTHPAEALRQYRVAMKKPEARLIVCGMQANEFTIADPEDPGMLDMAGFDSNAPEIMRNFILGLM